ncbi:MAG: hypothetical protein UU88_C0013G0032, partial [Parcubacteria group bacterium GW2011_GWC1_42_11]
CGREALRQSIRKGDLRSNEKRNDDEKNLFHFYILFFNFLFNEI